MNEPHIWWYLTRASALIAWVLLTASVLWGILLSTRVMRRIDNPAWLQDLHRYLGGLTLAMVALHMVTLMLDPWLQFTGTEVLVPFATDFKPIAIALGIIAFYGLVAVQGSSLMMKLLPRKFWKGLHYTSYVVLLLVSLHAGWSGTDVGSWWYRVLAIVLIGVATLAIIVRIVTGTATGGTRREAHRQTPGGVSEVTITPVGQRQAPTRSETRTMVVASIELVAKEIKAIRLVPLGGGVLPVWYPGAHITLHLPSGLQKQYSLCGDPAEREHFDIAVLNSPSSQGGSQWIHANLTVGMTLEVSGPLNHFELEPASEYLFIAGGIGITPIKAMIESLPQKRQWKLIYVGRSRSTMAFAKELSKRYPKQVVIHAGDEQENELDVAAEVEGTRAQVYCCGPESLMSTVAALVPAEQMHLERFIALERVATEVLSDVTVSCRKSKTSFTLTPEENLLVALEDRGIPVTGSCYTGVCGSCEVRVVEGTPIHLDSVMDDAEKDRLKIMYPCVSRASGTQLTLDV